MTNRKGVVDILLAAEEVLGIWIPGRLDPSRDFKSGQPFQGAMRRAGALKDKSGRVCYARGDRSMLLLYTVVAAAFATTNGRRGLINGVQPHISFGSLDVGIPTFPPGTRYEYSRTAQEPVDKPTVWRPFFCCAQGAQAR